MSEHEKNKKMGNEKSFSCKTVQAVILSLVFEVELLIATFASTSHSFGYFCWLFASTLEACLRVPSKLPFASPPNPKLAVYLSSPLSHWFKPYYHQVGKLEDCLYVS